MKKFKLFAFGISLFLVGALQAQVTVNVGSPPPWGPVGYTEVHYYYLPDVEAFYDIQTSMFVYYESGIWVHRGSLPVRYKNYDLYRGYKVVMTDYRGSTPYIHFNDYKKKYGKGYRGQPQKTIGQNPKKSYAPSNGNTGNKGNQGNNGSGTHNNNSGNGNKGGKGKK